MPNNDNWPKVKAFVGLHAKSYTWMVNFDMWARNFLSCHYLSPGLDRYYALSIKHYHLANSRQKETVRFLNFMVTTDTSRINWMYLSRTFTRKTFVEFISYLDLLLKTDNEDDKYELYTNWPVSDFFKVRIRETKAKVDWFLNLLYHFLKSLVIKLLLANRAKEYAYDADKLRTEAFNVLLSMLEKYHLHHSGFKVPFTSQLMWLSKPKKKEIVEYEMWGFGEDARILSLEPTDLEGEDYSTTENRTLQVEVLDKIHQDNEDLTDREEIHTRAEEVLSNIPSSLRDFLYAVTGIQMRGSLLDLSKLEVDEDA